MNERKHHWRGTGLAEAVGAYLIWGLLPLYLVFVKVVPPFEFVAWRIIWTLPVCLLIVAFRKQGVEVWRALSNRKAVLNLLASSALIALNWLTYIWSIQNDYIYAASLGYYINPLVNVLLGTMLLGERLSRLQWIAVAVASAGVALLLGGAITTLWISLVLAFSFGTYGLIRKRVAVGSLPGLTIESLILLTPSALLCFWYAQNQGSSFGHDLGLSLLIVAGGAITAIPLLLYALAAKRMSYSALGFTQFLAPTIVFILGLTVFDKPLQPVQLGSFVMIWIAIAIFAADLLKRKA